MRLILAAILALAAALPLPAAAQSDRTLADIRQELTVLFVEVQRLRRELATTGSPSVELGGDSVLDRVAAIEAELQRLTDLTEELGNRIDRIVADGTNRIGDLEFRLLELEGGDVSQLGETTTLGGGETPAVAAPEPVVPENTTEAPGTELAVGEQADFDAAAKALAEGDFGAAADLFARFETAYPGSPLGPRAHLSRGRALEGLGDTREAARAFLDGFTRDPEGEVAAETLYELGAALGRLGQTDQACLTLSEVEIRFPAAGAVAQARTEIGALGCP